MRRESKYKPTDKDVRCALWNAYDKKDAYTGEIISFRELEVDHVIPRDVFKNKSKKEEFLKELGLTSEFEMDSLDNYLPTRRGPNVEKGSDDEKLRIIHGLSKVKKNKDKVKKLIDEYNKETDLIVAAVNVAMLADTEEKKQAVVDIIFDEEEEFETDFLETRDAYRESISRVCIYANLPTIANMRPGCSFEFRPVKLRACIVSVGHEELFEHLFVGNGEKDMKYRPFVSSALENEDCQISLGGCFFRLSKKETIELCELVDRYNQRYFNRLCELENAYALSGMKINEFSEIKICTISKSFCKIVVQAIKDFHKGKKWDMFECNDMMIKVYTETENKEHNRGYHAIIWFREEKKDFWYLDGEIGLYLKTFSYTENNFFVSSKDWWTPMQVRKWLYGELFPKTLQWYAKKQKWKNYKKIDYAEEAKKYYSSEESGQLYVEDYMNINELIKCISKLQMFYSSVTSRRICLVDENAKGIYKILDILLKSCTEGLHIQFFREKLGVKVNSESQLFEEVSNLCREDKKEITYLQIDMLLRCCLECLNTGNVRLHATDYTIIWGLLEVLLVEYNYHMQRKRYI